MVILLPVFILLLTPFALLGANRLQPGFRSNWLVATGGALLSALSLIALWFALPLATSFAGWSLGTDLSLPYLLTLTNKTWPLVLGLVALFLIGQLTEVRRAPYSSWPTWVPSLLLCATAILVSLSGDLLAFAFSFFLLDLLTVCLFLLTTNDTEFRRQAILRFAINLISVLGALGVWALSFNWPWLSSGLLLLPAVVRIGLFTPRLINVSTETSRRDVDLMLRFSCPLSTMALFSLWSPLEHASSFVFWTFLAMASLPVFFIHAPRHWFPPRLAASQNRLLVATRPPYIVTIMINSVQWFLNLVSNLLEGEAGLLWALLFIALALAFLAPFGLAG